MKRALLISVLLVTLLLNACGSSTSTPTEKRGLADVVDYFRAQGLEVGEVVTKAYGMIGAVDGFGIYIEGDEVELYLFDPKRADEKTLNNLEDARRIGKFSAIGFSFPVLMNGNIMLTRYDEHPNKQRITRLFAAF